MDDKQIEQTIAQLMRNEETMQVAAILKNFLSRIRDLESPTDEAPEAEPPHDVNDLD